MTNQTKTPLPYPYWKWRFLIVIYHISEQEIKTNGRYA